MNFFWISQNISIYLKYPKMVLQQGGVQDIYSFQIGMKPQILNLTKDLGRFATQMAPEFGNLEHSPVEAAFGIFQIN